MSPAWLGFCDTQHTSSVVAVERFAALVSLTVSSLSRKVAAPAGCGASVESRTIVRTTPNPSFNVSGIRIWICVAQRFVH